MTIRHPTAFSAAPAAGFDGVFDWDFLIPAFAPTKIQPMDLDALIERRGKFLGFETKNGQVPIPQGQVITLESLVNTGLFIIIILRAKTPEEINGWDVWLRRNGEVVKEHREGTADALVEFVARWFEWASGSRAA